MNLHFTSNNPGSLVLRSILGLFALLSIVTGFSAHTGLLSPPSGAESMTVMTGSQYFAISMLLVYFEKLFPLYYAFAHFILLIPGGLFILRAISFAGFIATLIFIDMTHRSLPRRPSRAAIFATTGALPLLCFHAWRAEPVAPLAAMIAFIALTLARLDGISAEANGKRITIASILAFYTSLAAAPFVALACATLRRHGDRRFLLIIRACLPCLGLWLLALGRGALEMSWHRSLFGDYSRWASEGVWCNFIQQPDFALVIAVACPFFALKAAFTSDVSAAGTRSSSALHIFAWAAFVAGAYYFSAMSAQSVSWSRAFTYAASLTGGNTGIIALDNKPSRDDYYRFNSFVSEKGIAGAVIPVRLFAASGVQPRVTTGFREIKSSQDTANVLIKDTFLFSGNLVVIVADRTSTPDPRVAEALDWLEATGDVTSKKRFDRYFTVMQIEHDPAVAKDGVLLDLFVNDMRDGAKAARLIQEPDFTPEMLAGYYHGKSPEDTAHRTDRLMKACGDNEACRQAAAEKSSAFLHQGNESENAAAPGRKNR